MLTLTDARSGRVTAVGGRGLRLLAVPGTDPTTADRALVVADVVRRTVEVRGGRVAMWSARGAPSPARLLDLNVPPPDPPDDGPAPHVVVTAAGVTDGVQHADAGCVVVVGPVVADSPDSAAGDPLAVRLALLEAPYREQVALTVDRLTAAADRLTTLRRSVAGWADRPSAAPPRAVLDRFVAAVEDDVDTVAALSVVDRLTADPNVPDGAKFEVVAYADRVLALDLAREVGRS